MQQNVYNVIWVDDEVERFYEDSKQTLRRKGIKVISMAHNGVEFREQIEILYDRVDAVITDANFCKSENNLFTKKTVSGLRYVDSIISELNSKRSIPFYIYTNKYDLLQDRDDDEFEYFKKNNRIFQKTAGISDLAERIIADVNHINSLEFFLRNKYNNELEAAEKIRENENVIFDTLRYVFSNDADSSSSVYFYNELRKVVERIFVECKRRKIIPPLKSLNAWPKFLQNSDVTYKIIDDEEIMPIALVHGLGFLIELTQDGSHSCDTKLRVDDFIRNSGNINLLRCLLHIAMDICIWYNNYTTSNQNANDNSKKWKAKSVDGCEYEGEIVLVKVDEVDLYVCGEYLLSKDFQSMYQPGDRIAITQSVDNTRKKYSEYRLNGTIIPLTKYVNSIKNAVDLRNR